MPERLEVPRVEKAPESVRRYVKRLVHPAHPIAVGYLIDVGSEDKPVLIVGRSPMAYAVFRRIIMIPSVARLKRNVLLLWVDTTDQLDDPLSLDKLLLAEKGFQSVHCLYFCPSYPLERFLRHCRSEYFRCLRLLAEVAR